MTVDRGSKSSSVTPLIFDHVVITNQTIYPETMSVQSSNNNAVELDVATPHQQKTYYRLLQIEPITVESVTELIKQGKITNFLELDETLKVFVCEGIITQGEHSQIFAAVSDLFNFKLNFPMLFTKQPKNKTPEHTSGRCLECEKTQPNGKPSRDPNSPFMDPNNYWMAQTAESKRQIAQLLAELSETKKNSQRYLAIMAMLIVLLMLIVIGARETLNDVQFEHQEALVALNDYKNTECDKRIQYFQKHNGQDTVPRITADHTAVVDAVQPLSVTADSMVEFAIYTALMYTVLSFVRYSLSWITN